MVRTKVFVGNLSFKTQESDLSREFEAAGKVASANIISRGNRSLGYGFVEMESEEEAHKAVALLSKKSIDGREINVEVAKPREENAKEGGAPREPRPRRERAPRAPRPAGANGNAGQGQGEGQAAAGGEGGEGGAPRQARRRPIRRFPNRRPRQNADGSPAANNEGQAAAGGAPNQQRPPRVPREPREPREPKAPRPKREPRTAAPNTLFVANLPFSVDDASLAQVFAGLSLKSAHVVRKRNNRSKGFAFVEFNNEEDQKKGLAAADKKVVEGRELIVKIARTEPLPPAAAGDNNAANGAASPAAAKKEAAPANPAPASPKTN